MTYTASETKYDNINESDFSYCGEIVVNDVTMTIVDSDIECIATLN